MSNHTLPALDTLTSGIKAGNKTPSREDANMTALETQFPRILSNIISLWGYASLNEYLQKLTLDDRGGRLGFPADVWQEINLLASIHEEIVASGKEYIDHGSFSMNAK